VAAASAGLDQALLAGAVIWLIALVTGIVVGFRRRGSATSPASTAT
jgi:hypothetical protein